MKGPSSLAPKTSRNHKIHTKKLSKRKLLRHTFSTTTINPDHGESVAPSVMKRLKELTSSESGKTHTAAKALNLTERDKHDELFNQIGKSIDINGDLPPYDPKTGLFHDPTKDRKSSQYISGPNIHDNSNVYSLATRNDNDEYTRQTTILNSFQHKMGELNSFLPPFFQRTKQKEIQPSTRSEMNAMLHHAIILDGDYELGWDRFSKMIHSQPDYLKSWLEMSLFDQYNKPLLMRRDTDVQADNQKVIFGPDRRGYELMLVGCLQALNKLKQHFQPQLVADAETIIKEGGDINNSANDDEMESPASMMYRALEELNREIERRKSLPRAEQDRLLGLDRIAAENGGLMVHDDVDSSNVGLKRALRCLVSEDEEGISNRLVYSNKGITQKQHDKQVREQMMALGRTIIDITDDPSNTNGGVSTIQYKAGRKIVADDSDEDDAHNNNATEKQHKEISTQNTKSMTPLITARTTSRGNLRYKINLPALPFSIEEGDEYEAWMEKLEDLSQSSIFHSQTIQDKRKEMLADPFSEPYHCLQQMSTWNSRLHFLCRDILEHYYGALYKTHPTLYKAIRSTTTPPLENYSGTAEGFNDSMGFNLEVLDHVISAAKEEELFHIWLEATTLKHKLSPAPIKIPTISERKIMIKENFVKNMILNDILQNIPTGIPQNENDVIPKLSIGMYFKCVGLFTDYAFKLKNYNQQVEKYDRSFIVDYNIQRKQEFFLDNLPRKIQRGEEARYVEMKEKQAKFEAALKSGNPLNDEEMADMPVDFITNYKLIRDFSTLEDVMNHFTMLNGKGDQNSDIVVAFKAQYHKLRPQQPDDLIMMESIIRENLRRYPLLACMVPPYASTFHKTMSEIIKELYFNLETDYTTLPPQLHNIILANTLPINPATIDITQYGFDSLQKLNDFPYPPQVQEDLAKIDVTMVKMPIINVLLVPPNDISITSSQSNYKSLMVTPATTLMKMDEALQWINDFTQMGQFLRVKQNQMGVVEECEEYNYQIQQSAFFKEHFGVDIPFYEIQNNSVNFRTMARVGLYVLDTIIISWAQQNEVKLPEKYAETVVESYKELTNDTLFQEINANTFKEEEPKQEQSAAETTNISKKNIKKQVDDIDNKSLLADLAVVNPHMSRIEQWRHKTLNDSLTNPAKFFAMQIDDRVELIEKTQDDGRATNGFARFFNDLDIAEGTQSSLDKQTQGKPTMRYNMLRAYLRFAMRAGDEVSLKKALIVYRSTSRLLEYVQRRSNEDVYMDTTKAFNHVTSEEDYHKVTEQLEQRRQRQDAINQHIPPATRLDMTRDDVEKSTKNLGPVSQMWNDWYATDGMVPNKGSVQQKLSQDPRSQGGSGGRAADDWKERNETDSLLAESGLLDDYTDRIDNLLRSKRRGRNSVNNDDDDDDHKNVDELKAALYKKDEEEIELYTKVLKQRKSKKLGALFVPGFDMSDAEDENDQAIVKQHMGDDYEIDQKRSSGSSAPSQQIGGGSMSMEVGKGGSFKAHDNDDNENDPTTKKPSEDAQKHAPHNRLKKLAQAPHIPFDYLTTQMVINFHQSLIRNQKSFYRLGLPPDVDSKRFSDEVSAQWALTRRGLYDTRINTLAEFDAQMNSPNITPGDKRLLQREKTKMAVQMLKKNRQEADLHDFEKRAGQIAIMTVDTLLLEGYLPVAKIVAKQAFDDGLLSKEFIDDCFENNGPDLDDDENAILNKELGLDQIGRDQ